MCLLIALCTISGGIGLIAQADPQDLTLTNLQDVSFAVEGMVRMTFTGAGRVNDGNAPPPRLPFLVRVSGCRWQIDLPECESAPTGAISYYYDGAYVYMLNTFKHSTIESKRAARSATNVATARIQSLPLPRDRTAYEASFLWLAYCSGCQFSPTPRGIPPVFAYSGGFKYYDSTETEARLQYYSRISTRPPYVPMFLATRENSRVPQMSGGPTAFVISGKQFTNLLYTVVAITNVGFIALPTIATAELIVDPELLKGSATLKEIFKNGTFLKLELQAVTFRLERPTLLAGPPPLPGPTAITVEVGNGYIAHYANQHSWIEREAIKDSRKIYIGKAADLTMATTRTRERLLILVTLVLVSFLPILINILRKKYKSAILP